MGTVTQRLAAAAMRAGARIHTGQGVGRWGLRAVATTPPFCHSRRKVPARAAVPLLASAACLPPCRSILVEGGAARGIVTAGGAERRARAVLVNADPYRLRELAGGEAAFAPDFNRRLDGMRRDGTTMKVGGWLAGCCC